MSRAARKIGGHEDGLSVGCCDLFLSQRQVGAAGDAAIVATEGDCAGRNEHHLVSLILVERDIVHEVIEKVHAEPSRYFVYEQAGSDFYDYCF